MSYGTPQDLEFCPSYWMCREDGSLTSWGNSYYADRRKWNGSEVSWHAVLQTSGKHLEVWILRPWPEAAVRGPHSRWRRWSGEHRPREAATPRSLRTRESGRPGGAEARARSQEDQHTEQGEETETRPEHQNKEKPWRPICRQLGHGGGLLKVLGADLWVVWLHSRALSWWSASKCLTQRQRRKGSGPSLAVQSTSSAMGTDSLPGRGTKILHVVCHGQNKLKKYLGKVEILLSTFHQHKFWQLLVWKSVRKTRLQTPGEWNHSTQSAQEILPRKMEVPATSRPSLCLALLATNA